MKVLVVNNMAPFVWGGAEELARNLVIHLAVAGHEAELLRIPFQWEPATVIPSQMMMVRALELWNVDHVIALKFPAYLIRHPSKSLWLVHQYRQAYDLFDLGHTNLPAGEVGTGLREMIRAADEQCFAECRSIHTVSPVISERLLHSHRRSAPPLRAPLNDPENFPGGDFGDYVFVGGRVNAMKRQHLMIEALAQVDPGIGLVVAGPPDGPDDARRLVDLVARHGLEERVKLDLRFLPRSTYAAYLNNAAAVAYLPFMEDSIGYVVMEGACAGKPLITTTDSGGVLDLVSDEETGWVAPPDATSLANVLRRVFAESASAREYGAAARRRWNAMGITWERTVQALLP